jgi:hypothetical protein
MKHERNVAGERGIVLKQRAAIAAQDILGQPRPEHPLLE